LQILVTGGLGYIGSHTCVELLNEGNDVIVVDNLSNSKIEAMDRIYQITNRKIKFYKEDILDKNALRNIFNENSIDSVIHFAGVKAVGESVENPLKYYENNVFGTVNLCEVMNEYNVKSIVFSSSATVYGIPDEVPIVESADCRPMNPYGRTKRMVEEILEDLFNADKSWNIKILRYFNPIGAHSSGLIGEDPNDIPNNLMPYITQVAIGKRNELNVFGDDYDTYDGTGVRDYIHVVDLAKGHVNAVKNKLSAGYYIYNLGTGIPYSVFDVINNFKKANNLEIPFKIVERRAGDIASYYGNPKKAFDELGWKAEKNLEDMCRDSWNWQKKNPKGY
jgi:UDP-glucose 4-epimerase